MSKHIIFFNTKGGVGKSTLCEFMAMEFYRLGKSFSVDNIDQQKHVNEVANGEADFCLYDTFGAFTKSNMDLLRDASAEDSVVIIPVSTGRNDMAEIDFLVSNLEKCGIFDKSVFVFNRTRVNNKRLLECKREIINRGGVVCSHTIPALDAFANGEQTSRTTNEISALMCKVGIL